MNTPIQQQPTTAIDPATTVGLLSLSVADLARSVSFYTEAIGLVALRRDSSTAILGAAGTPLLLLSEHPGARPWPRGGASYTGLYHFALLLPERADLGRWLRHWLDLGFPLPGQGDHLVSEALYLEDPDGNGIEIYRDRPRSEWRWANGQVRMATDPVDIRGVLADGARSGESWVGMPAGTRLGHMHLQIGDIPQAVAFYHDVLGFDIVARMPTALFISAGGYHHHIGLNTWHSNGASPAPVGTAGLRFFTVDLPTEEARQAVVARLVAAGLPYTSQSNIITVMDPWRNTLLLQVGSAVEAQGGAALASVFAEARAAQR
ncbi:MAG TPA: VOC family protein [Chloroflexota bacterium]|nr:VOC family protein [Chloroflexota bacterium]